MFVWNSANVHITYGFQVLLCRIIIFHPSNCIYSVSFSCFIINWNPISLALFCYSFPILFHSFLLWCSNRVPVIHLPPLVFSSLCGSPARIGVHPHPHLVLFGTRILHFTVGCSRCHQSSHLPAFSADTASYFMHTRSGFPIHWRFKK